MRLVRAVRARWVDCLALAVKPLRSPTPRPVVPRAVHANRGVEAAYRRALERLIEAMARSVIWHVTRAYAADQPVHGLAQDAPNSSIRLRRVLSKWGRKWVARFNALSTEMAARFADKATRTTETAFMASLKDAGFTVSFSTTPAQQSAYAAVIAENVGLIRSIPQQFLKDVETSVWQSVMAGHDVNTLAKDLHAKYDITWRRAALIARDQNNKAKAVMENVRRRELGIKEAIWIHSGGGRTPRPSHVKAGRDRQRFDVAKGWYDPDEEKWILPGQLISCRCVSRPVIPGYNDGA